MPIPTTPIVLVFEVNVFFVSLFMTARKRAVLESPRNSVLSTYDSPASFVSSRTVPSYSFLSRTPADASYGSASAVGSGVACGSSSSGAEMFLITSTTAKIRSVRIPRHTAISASVFMRYRFPRKLNFTSLMVIILLYIRSFRAVQIHRTFHTQAISV